MPHRPATIHAVWSRSPHDLAGAFAGLLPDARRPLPIVPAPLERDSVPVSALRAAWRNLGRRTTLLLPRPGIASMLSGSSSRWKSVDVQHFALRLDSRIAGRPYISCLVLSETLAKGPFVLDLPARFLHPVDRVRLAARPDRHQLNADVTAAAPPHASILLSRIAGGWLGLATADAIAADLWALGLAERWLADDIEARGPWEDETVQRATELNLGVRIPSEMRVEAIGDMSMPSVAHELLVEVASRLGMPHLTVIR